MGKSSASLKRKRSKNSAKARAKRKIKSRKYKSKKLCHREMSLSSSDYDDSTSLNASLSSSSEDRNYRSRRERSRTQKDVKGRKKRARRHSYSPDSSEDSLHVRKRKRAKKKNEDEVRERSYQKKKLRKQASVSSVSSGSWSCSTCQGGSASSEVERCRGRLERKEKDKRRLRRGRSGSVRSSRYGAKSCSSYSHCSESCDEWTEERYMCENNSRRLRSVITVTKEAEESRELCRNETKEEIVDDHDYPCRSNDSYDGGCKRELDQHHLPALEGKVRVEDEKGEANTDFNFTEPEIRDRSYNSGAQYDRNNLKVYGAGTSESIEKETTDTSGDSLNSERLELTLKLKALENLRKFQLEALRAAKASDQKNKIGSDVKQPLIEKHEVVQDKSIVNNSAIRANFDKKTLVEETSLPGRRDTIASLRNNESSLNGDNVISGSVKHHSTCAPEKVIDAINPTGTMIATESRDHSLTSQPSLKQTPTSRPPPEKSVATESIIDKHTIGAAHFVSQSSKDNVKNVGGLCSAAPKPSCPVPNFRHSNLNKGQDEVKEHYRFELKQTSASNEPPLRMPLVTAGNGDKNAVTNAQAGSQSINNSGRDVRKLSNSATSEPCSESSSVQNSSNKLQDEANQGSQFEQKTMNVMRGGEMVQVNYKVYIPKKTPALARRQLER